jgi:TDG/mug DNA glycosylase family protein
VTADQPGRPERSPQRLDTLRLPDIVAPGLRVLFVGINPGLRSATLGHHFAGFSNRFWKLLFESGLTPEQLSAVDDRRLLEWGMGITNLVGRPTAGVSGLRREEYVRGVRVLERKVHEARPQLAALVGVSIYRVLFRWRGPVRLGLQVELLEGANVFVLPNPSGRNAHYSYPEMLESFRDLQRELERRFKRGPSFRSRAGRGRR